MKDKVYTIEQLVLIQLKIKEFISFVEQYDRLLPYCFDNCRHIIKNIEICKNNKYSDIECLSEYIKQDWKSAMGSHCGLSDYYILDTNFEIQKNINCKISEFIDVIDTIIG